MVALCAGRLPAKVFVLAARLGAAAALSLVAGCASDRTPSYVQGPAAHQIAAAPPHKVEMEDDGEPVQPPPMRKLRPEEDDPSQPWSPNYGRGDRTPEPRQAQAARDIPMSAASVVSVQMTASEADALVAQAIVAQETSHR